MIPFLLSEAIKTSSLPLICDVTDPSGAKVKPKFTPKAPPKKEIVEVVVAPVVAVRFVRSYLNIVMKLSVLG